MGYSKQYKMENERMILSFEEQEHFASFKAKLPTTNEQSLPQWIVDIETNNDALNELKISKAEAAMDMELYKRMKRTEKIMTSGLTANNLNLPFHLKSGNNIKK